METRYAHDCNACRAEEVFVFHHRLHNTNVAYRWTCPECGVELDITFKGQGTQSFQTQTGRRCERTLDLLRYKLDPRLMIIAKGIRWDHSTPADEKHHYEVRTCPSNFLGCEEVIICGDDDPHGTFELVESIDLTGPNKVADREDAEMKLKAKARHLTLEAQARAR